MLFGWVFESHLDHMEIFQLTCQISKSPGCWSAEGKERLCLHLHSDRGRWTHGAHLRGLNMVWPEAMHLSHSLSLPFRYYPAESHNTGSLTTTRLGTVKRSIVFYLYTLTGGGWEVCKVVRLDWRSTDLCLCALQVLLLSDWTQWCQWLCRC